MELMSTIHSRKKYDVFFTSEHLLHRMMLIPIFRAFTVKPFLIRGPQNQTAVVGNSVTFQCRVGGEPVPDVLWRRSASGGNMPLRK